MIILRCRHSPYACNLYQTLQSQISESSENWVTSYRQHIKVVLYTVVGLGIKYSILKYHIKGALGCIQPLKLYPNFSKTVKEYYAPVIY